MVGSGLMFGGETATSPGVVVVLDLSVSMLVDQGAADSSTRQKCAVCMLGEGGCTQEFCHSQYVSAHINNILVPVLKGSEP